MSKKKSTYIEVVKELPKARRISRRKEKYDKTLKQFLESNVKYAKVKPEVGKSAAVFSALTKRIKRGNLPVRVRVRTDPETKRVNLYLERTDL